MVQPNNKLIELGTDEKLSSVMVYLNDHLVLGNVITKSIIRVSTWLRTNAAPETIAIYNAQLILVNLPTPARPIAFDKLHIPTKTINAFHLAPPAQDPLDYDPNEPNRILVQVNAIAGSFRLDGKLRMASITNLSHYLETTHELFTSMYDVEVSNPGDLKWGVIRTPFALVRQENTLFAGYR